MLIAINQKWASKNIEGGGGGFKDEFRIQTRVERSEK
jgi:hypothetical protein